MPQGPTICITRSSPVRIASSISGFAAAAAKNPPMPPNTAEAATTARNLGSARRLSCCTESFISVILPRHSAEFCQLERQCHRRGVIPPFDLTDGLTGYPYQTAHLLLINSQPCPVFFEPVVKRHLLHPQFDSLNCHFDNYHCHN